MKINVRYANCEVCGKLFKKPRKNSKYCSQKCYGISKKITNIIIENFDHLIMIVNNKEVYLSCEDLQLAKSYRWRISNKGYVTTTINRKTKLLHRLIMNCPENMVVDHINHNPLDNRRSNLRICKQKENIQNQKEKRKNISSTGKVGVYKRKDGKYVSHIQINKKRSFLGIFDDLEKAIAVRLQAERGFYGRNK